MKHQAQLKYAVCMGVLVMLHPGGWIGECAATMLSYKGRAPACHNGTGVGVNQNTDVHRIDIRCDILIHPGPTYDTFQDHVKSTVFQCIASVAVWSFGNI